MFLRPSEQAQASVAGAEVDKRVVKQKANALERVRVNEVAKNGNERAEIETE